MRTFSLLALSGFERCSHSCRERLASGRNLVVTDSLRSMKASVLQCDHVWPLVTKIMLSGCFRLRPGRKQQRRIDWRSHQPKAFEQGCRFSFFRPPGANDASQTCLYFQGVRPGLRTASCTRAIHRGLAPSATHGFMVRVQRYLHRSTSPCDLTCIGPKRLTIRDARIVLNKRQYPVLSSW